MTDKRPLILVIDDEAHITHVVALKLRNAGYEVIAAADGEEGFEAALANLPAIIITDLQMPYLNGLELSRKLCSTKATSAIPVLMLTARGFGLTSDDLSGTNIVGMLSKPFSPREVLEKIQELLACDDRQADVAGAAHSNHTMTPGRRARSTGHDAGGAL